MHNDRTSTGSSPQGLLVKNMVCTRCVMTVENILRNASISFQKVLFGEIHLNQRLANTKRQILQKRLEKAGFELIDNHHGNLIENIRTFPIEKARNKTGQENSQSLSITFPRN